MAKTCKAIIRTSPRIGKKCGNKIVGNFEFCLGHRSRLIFESVRGAQKEHEDMHGKAERLERKERTSKNNFDRRLERGFSLISEGDDGECT